MKTALDKIITEEEIYLGNNMRLLYIGKRWGEFDGVQQRVCLFIYNHAFLAYTPNYGTKPDVPNKDISEVMNESLEFFAEYFAKSMREKVKIDNL